MGCFQFLATVNKIAKNTFILPFCGYLFVLLDEGVELLSQRVDADFFFKKIFYWSTVDLQCLLISPIQQSDS